MDNKPDHSFLIGAILGGLLYLVFRNPIKALVIFIVLYALGSFTQWMGW